MEDAICNSRSTRQVDQQLNQRYQQVSRQFPPAVREGLHARQLNWLTQRDRHIRQTCFVQANTGLINQCIVNYYQQRISTLARWPVTQLSRVMFDPPTNIRSTPNGAVRVRWNRNR
ncbi:MAG: lysozyme inhibitor LprI family protein [Thiolinea sp.]